MIEPRLVMCSGAEIPADDPRRSGRHIVELDSVTAKANVNLLFENVARVFNKDVSPRLTDLLEIATYVYTADCATNRGSGWSDDGASEPWSRDFSFVVPVRDVAFWSQSDIQRRLADVLHFLSNDKFEFHFSELNTSREESRYFEFGDLETWPFYGVERVIMFSGGLDSLAGAVESASRGDKLVLVSHRSVTTLDSRQRNLSARLKQKYAGQIVHIPVWINKDVSLGRESTQRTRSFLYAALGTVIAESVKSGGVRFFENGIVSLNLPVADEVLRARASRTTHPAALHMFTELFRMVTGRDFVVDNPYFCSTKTEVVRKIAENNAAELIGQSCSCSHSMFKSKTQWHCGTCSQCIDRRFAVLAAGLESQDAPHDYVCDVFTGARKDGYEKNMAVDYIRHTLELNRMSEGEFTSRFNSELTRAVKYEPRRSEAAQGIIGTHKRHAAAVTNVLYKQLSTHSAAVAEGTLPESSMLGAVFGRKHLDSTWNRYCDRISSVLNSSLPTMCASHAPENEKHLQELCDGVLKCNDSDFVREYPFMRWSSSLAKPDWSMSRLNLLVEAKYIRKRGEIRRITEEIAADITKYGDNDYRVLFVVYDPQHCVTDEGQFSEPIVSRPSMKVAFIR